METIEVKKKQYEILERLSSYQVKVKDENKYYVVYDFSDNRESFLDFKFAYKRLKNSGVTIPTVYKIDKKLSRAVVEYIPGSTIFDDLRDHDLDEKIIEEAFILNYKARINNLRLDFNPWMFTYQNDKLIYLPFTFTNYVREEDFTQKEIRLWFYTNEFKYTLIEKGLPIDKSRLKNEYERNKEIVLQVVKYFR